MEITQVHVEVTPTVIQRNILGGNAGHYQACIAACLDFLGLYGVMVSNLDYSIKLQQFQTY